MYRVTEIQTICKYHCTYYVTRQTCGVKCHWPDRAADRLTNGFERLCLEQRTRCKLARTHAEADETRQWYVTAK